MNGRFILFGLIFLSLISFVSADNKTALNIDYKEYQEKSHQNLSTTYIDFYIPLTATTYWNNNGLDTYEVIQEVDIENNGRHYFKYTWNDERYLDETFNINFNIVGGVLNKDNIELVSQSKTPKLTFSNLDIQKGTIIGTEIIPEYINTTHYNKVEYPIYKWVNFKDLTLKFLPPSFLAKDDINVSACNTVLNSADTVYTLNQSLTCTGFSTAISVNANNVTFDLQGFTLQSGDGNQNGIAVNVGASGDDLTIRNGTVKGFILNFIISDVDNLTISRINALDGIGLGASIFNPFGGTNYNHTYEYNIFNTSTATHISASDITYGIARYNEFYRGGDGLQLSNANNWTVHNNIFNGQAGSGFSAPGSSNYNIVHHNTYYNCTHGGGNPSCISITGSNNYLYNEYMNVSQDNCYGSFSGSDNKVVDSLFENCGTGVSVPSGSVNNYLLNVTYDNETVGVAASLYRQWYYKAQVVDSVALPINGATVIGKDVLGSPDFTELTDGSGYITQQNLTEYISISGTKNYYTPYNMTASKSGYYGDNHTITLTTNKVDDIFTLIFIEPFITYHIRFYDNDYLKIYDNSYIKMWDDKTEV